jgi:hypothetical protein
MIIIGFSYRKVSKKFLFKVADYLLFAYHANQRSIMLSNLYAIKGDKSMTNKHFNRYKLRCATKGPVISFTFLHYRFRSANILRYYRLLHVIDIAANQISFYYIAIRYIQLAD